MDSVIDLLTQIRDLLKVLVDYLPILTLAFGFVIFLLGVKIFRS